MKPSIYGNANGATDAERKIANLRQSNPGKIAAFKIVRFNIKFDPNQAMEPTRRHADAYASLPGLSSPCVAPLVDEFNNSTVWDDLFDTEFAVLVAAKKSILEETSSPFVGPSDGKPGGKRR